MDWTNIGVGETETRFFDYPAELLPHELQSGETLPALRLAYEIYGEINHNADNVILVFHALTGSQHVSGYTPSVAGVDRWPEECQRGWWSNFVGPDLAIDTNRFAVVCVNYLGGCYGSTGPSSINPATGRRYGSDFPSVTLADVVDAQMPLLDHLGIRRLHAVIGGSVGGMMCVSLATRYPDRVLNVIPIAAGLETTELQFLHNFEQVVAIRGDAHYQGGDYYDGPSPDHGLALARMIGHKTFVSLEAMEERARNSVVTDVEGPPGYEIEHHLESYIWYQGQKFLLRFDANTYVLCMTIWQHFDLLAEAGASDLTELLSRCRDQNFMVFSIDSDVCFYPDEQERMVNELRRAGVSARRVTVHSDKGHDSFLLEPELFAPHLMDTLEGGRRPEGSGVDEGVTSV